MKVYMFENVLQRGLYHVVKDFACANTHIVKTGTYDECNAYMKDHQYGNEVHHFTLPDTRALGRTGYINHQ